VNTPDNQPHSEEVPAMPTAEQPSVAQSFEVNISQDKLKGAVSLVSKAVAKHPLQPILLNVFFRAAKDKLTLLATDINFSLSTVIDAEVISEGELTIPAQKLQEIVNKLPNGQVRLKQESSGELFLRCGRAKFSLKTAPSDHFPKEALEETPKPEDIADLELPLNALKKSCELVSFASDKREASSILNGICLEIQQENGLELAATDGSRLAYYQLSSCKDISPVHQKVVIPYRAINELSRIMSDLSEGTVKCQIKQSESIRFDIQGRCLLSNLIEGSYPKYQQLIPSSHSKRAVVDREALIDTLERVAVLANEKSKVIKLLFDESGTLTISANIPDLGEAQDQLDVADYEGEALSLAFNVNYMLECLRVLSNKQIEITMTEPLKPLILRPLEPDKDDKTDSFNYLYLLMPVQLRS